MSDNVQPVRFNLLVLRCADINRAMELYATLGLTFKKEQHGKGPEHFSSDVDGILFEIYPRRESDSSPSTRIGFLVTSVDDAVSKWTDAGGDVVTAAQDSPWGRRAVVADWDGHRVELTESS